MRIAIIYQHYKITPQKLKELLGVNGIDVDLRFVKEVPENWIEILSIETGIPKIDLNNYIPPKKEITNIDKDTKGIENSASSKKSRNNSQHQAFKHETYFA